MELFAKVGDGMKVEAAYRGGVGSSHFSTEDAMGPAKRV
jgi:hypothetical protein